MSVAGSNSRRDTAGFTLLEVMIAVVIFSIGLLGIAGLQVAGMRFTHGSQLRAIATMQAENMADRLRTNIAGVNAYNYNITGAMPTSYAKDCDNVVCTPAELATFDLVSWNLGHSSTTKPREGNANVLPGGAGVVCLDSTPTDGTPSDWACDNAGFVYAIKVFWVERTTGKDDTMTDESGNASEDKASQRLVMRIIP
jgi:type IV pilus assembly protein PilV